MPDPATPETHDATRTLDATGTLDVSETFDAKILVVDDNPANLLFLAKLLRRSGWTDVTTTLVPEHAERIVREGGVDLAIVDLHMPGIGGFGLLERLRAPGVLEGYLPILVFTADVGGSARQRALELGATDFLTKPGDAAEIVLRVRNFLAMRRLYRRVEAHNAALETRVRERTRSLEAAHREIVDRLALAGDYRDDETGDHCRRVGDLSARIARAYGLSEAEAELIRLAAPLHDIGKVAIPDAVLRKPGRLSAEEFAEMRRHVLVGGRILADSTSEILQVAHIVAMTHHERWDGTGYGLGLAGEAIPIEGRVVAVADVFDALTSDRPYKAAWSVAAARAEIERGAGTHFDPKVVAAFLAATAETAAESLDASDRRAA